MEMRHVAAPGAVQGVLPVGRSRIEAAGIEMPDRVVTEYLPGGAAQQCAVSLGAQSLFAYVVLILVLRLDQEERPAGTARILLQSRLVDRAVGIDIVEGKPRFAGPVLGDGRFRIAVSGMQDAPVDLADALHDRRGEPLVRRIVIAAVDPDDVVETLVAAPEIAAVVTQLVG